MSLSGVISFLCSRGYGLSLAFTLRKQVPSGPELGVCLAGVGTSLLCSQQPGRGNCLQMKVWERGREGPGPPEPCSCSSLSASAVSLAHCSPPTPYSVGDPFRNGSLLLACLWVLAQGA